MTINRTCPECGDRFTTTRIDCRYCSDDCRNGNQAAVEVELCEEHDHFNPKPCRACCDSCGYQCDCECGCPASWPVVPAQRVQRVDGGSLPIARNANVDRLADKLRTFGEGA